MHSLKEAITMAKVCEICGKSSMAGRSIKRRGLAKKKGGVGRKITGISKRVFKVNLKTVKAKLGNTIKRITICTKCLKAGKVKKA
jgi:large subunit ribosomal protein L28